MADLKARTTEEVVGPLDPDEAVQEANRCLYCYDAPCIQGCPTHIDIPVFIRGIATGHLKGAARTILDANILGATCARVCPTEALCEGACVVGKHQRPVSIGRLQRHATDWLAQRGEQLFTPGSPTGRRVAIVGAGPAGLGCAFELRRAGHAVVMFESRPEAGGLDTYGIVSYRLPVAVSRWEVEQVRAMGAEIRTGVTVGRDVAFADLVRDYDAVFLAVGLRPGPKLGIPGEDLAGVYDALDLIERHKRDQYEGVELGDRVAVIGAGNTAVDAATLAVRMGAAEVMILYRRSEAEMTAYRYEYEFAKEEGVHYHFLTAPTRILGEGRVTGIECVRQTLGEPDERGRRTSAPVPGSEHVFQVTSVIRAIGQAHPGQLWESWGLEHRGGRLVVDPATMRTSHPRVFAGGDASGLTRDVTVVDAVEQGKRAAHAMAAALGEGEVA